MLKEKIYNTNNKIGIKDFKRYLINNNAIGITFEIGEGYHFNKRGNIKNSYLKNSYKKVMEIYNFADFNFDILVWIQYPLNEMDYERKLKKFIKLFKIENPNEQEYFKRQNEFKEDYTEIFNYWNLEKNKLNVEKLIKEITKADIGGFKELVYYTFLIDTTNNVIFNYYDDRGLHLMSDDMKKLKNIYVEYNKYIFDYDREKIKLNFENIERNLK